MASPTPAELPVPRVDRELLRVYLDDHLAGSVAGVRRLGRTAEILKQTPVGPGLAEVATQVATEHEELSQIVADLGFSQSLPKEVATWLGERIMRLKSSSRLIRRSPMAALLEVELLRSAVMGKRGVWQTLVDLGPAIGINPARPAALVQQTERQLEVLDAAHEYVRLRALRERAAR